MKNYWMTFDIVKLERTGYGNGIRDVSLLGANEVIRYRDTLAEVQAEPTDIDLMAKDAAENEIDQINRSSRTQAFVRKDYYARQFLADTASAADKTLTGAAGLAAIDPLLYPPIYKEYAATHHLVPWTPWELCEAITAKADAVDDAEVLMREKKLNAESVLAQPRPAIPDE